MVIACFLWQWGLLYPTSICVMEAHRDDFDLVCRVGGGEFSYTAWQNLINNLCTSRWFGKELRVYFRTSR